MFQVCYLNLFSIAVTILGTFYDYETSSDGKWDDGKDDDFNSYYIGEALLKGNFLSCCF